MIILLKLVKNSIKTRLSNVIERMRCLLSYGNDMDNNDNPFECGLDKYVNLNGNIEFLGKKALQKANRKALKEN